MSDLLFVLITALLFVLLRGFLVACTLLGGESATVLRTSERPVTAPTSSSTSAHRPSRDVAP